MTSKAIRAGDMVASAEQGDAALRAYIADVCAKPASKRNPFEHALVRAARERADAAANEIRIDEASRREGEWCWYVVNLPDDDGRYDVRAVERAGEWRIYFETLAEAKAEMGHAIYAAPYDGARERRGVERVLERRADLERIAAIARIAGALASLEDLGSSDMGHLSLVEARRFHAATGKLRALVDDLVRTVPAAQEG